MTIMTLCPTQDAPAQPLRGTSSRANFERIAWMRSRDVTPGFPAEGRSIHLETFLDDPKRRNISLVGTMTEISASDLMDEIGSIIRNTYRSEMFEFPGDFSEHLEYALSNSHCTTVVSGLNDSEGVCRGLLATSFGPR